MICYRPECIIVHYRLVWAHLQISKHHFLTCNFARERKDQDWIRYALSDREDLATNEFTLMLRMQSEWFYELNILVFCNTV